MELTIDKLKNSSSEQIFYLFTDLFLKIYNEYCSLKLSRSDFKIYITTIIEIIKHDIDKINIDDYKNSIEEYIEKRVRESLDDYKLNRTSIKRVKPKVEKTTTDRRKKEKRNIKNDNDKKRLISYLKIMNLTNKTSELILTLDNLEQYLKNNSFEFDSGLYYYLVTKKIIYNIVERITDRDLESISKKNKISDFIINLVEAYFDYNAASDEIDVSELDNYDSVKIYLKELPSKLLTKEEEQELFIKYRNGDDSAREELINCNLRLVVSIAKKYTYVDLPFLEIISEGNIGLMTAVEKFNSDYGLKFSTYATWWIRQAITRAIADKSRIVRIPVHVHEKLCKLKKVQDKLNIDYGRPASIDEIAEYMNEKTSYIEKLMKYLTPTLSLNAPLQTGSHRQEDSESEMGYFIESEVESPIEATERSELKNEIDKLYIQAGLKEREIEVLNLRYGRVDGYLWTLDDVGKKYGVTRERIRQIEERGLKKLKKCSKTREFAIYMDDPEKALAKLPYKPGKTFFVQQNPIVEEKIIEEETNELEISSDREEILDNIMKININRKEDDDMANIYPRKSIYELFSQYTEEEVYSVLQMLSEDDIDLLYRRDGFDLKHPDLSIKISEEDYNKFYGTVRTRIRRLLEKNYGKREKEKKTKKTSKKSKPVNVLEEQKKDVVEPVVNDESALAEVQASDDRYKPDLGLEALANGNVKLQKEELPKTGLEPVEEQQAELVDAVVTEAVVIPETGLAPATDKTIDHNLDTPTTGLEPVEEQQADLVNVVVAEEAVIPETGKEPVIEQETNQLQTNDTNMSLDRANAILEVLNMPTFNQIYQVLGTKDAVIISLALGKVDGKFFEAKKIADFLGMTEAEVNESVKRILEVYKEHLIGIINDAIATVSSNPKVLEKNDNTTGYNK